MTLRLIQFSVLSSFASLIAIAVVAEVFAGTPIGSVGLLLGPGIWLVYAKSGASNHDLLPLLAALLVDLLIYSLIFAVVLALRPKGARPRTR